jgi:ribulose-5-phosphate 4-epimerase/fuculose-1-phosphate aldolase
MAVEGVTFFQAMHRAAPHGAAALDVLPALAAWRAILAGTGGIGQDDARYDGAGYGNVSVRVGPFPGRRGARAFVVSATQTGGLDCVGPEHFAKVERYDPASNTVWSTGPQPPSSESMTHGALYDLAPHLRAVVHVHCPTVFRAADALKLPSTKPHIGYGTPAMAREMERLWRSSTLPEVQALIMAGHEDGVIAIGRTLAEAGTVMVALHARALALGFSSSGGVCRPT